MEPYRLPDDAALRRFWSRVDRIDDATSCWRWLGTRVGTGKKGKNLRYGTLRFDGRTMYAHRVSWQLANGLTVPRDVEILHSCDEPACVRPDHLSPGTHAENMADCARKRRIRCNPHRGEANYAAKLTPEKAQQIRDAWPASSMRALAARFGVSLATIQRVTSNRAWPAHLASLSRDAAF